MPIEKIIFTFVLSTLDRSSGCIVGLSIRLKNIKKKRMKSVFSLILFFFCLRSSAQLINLQDSLVTSRGVAGLSFRNSLDSIRNQNPSLKFLSRSSSEYGISGDLNGWLVVFKGDTLFYLCPDVVNQDLIGGFEILSSRFVCPSGIRVGFSIRQCREINRDFYLARDGYIEEEEYFDLKEIKNQYGGSFFSATLRFPSSVDKRVGIYKSNREREKTARFSDVDVKSCRISLIRIE